MPGITASHENRGTILDVVARTAEVCFMPLSVGGGIRSVEDGRRLLLAGADKISIMTAAVNDRDVVARCADAFGSQAVVVSVDAKRTCDHWEVFTHGGRNPTGLNAVDYAVEVVARGAGEILLTSIDRDGTLRGYDLELLGAVTRAVSVPVTAAGGAGCYADMAAALLEGDAGAVAAASMFHFTEPSGIRQVFMVTGGGAMHLNNSFGKHPTLRVLFNHHEQACAMAAESYARVSGGRMALLSVTSGPGGTNAITGVLGAWQDSIPMLVVSGQVRYDTTVRSTGLPLRQMGDQEFDIARAVESMTKYAVMVTDPSEIRYHLERALHLARIGRPGPCWIDIPMNVQGAAIEPEGLRGYDPAEDAADNLLPVPRETIREIIGRIRSAERPVVLAGSAIRLAGAREEFLRLVSLLRVPLTTAFNAHDLVPDNHPLYVGRPGTVGDRFGNFAVQNSDLLLILGCRLNIRQISYNWGAFARNAYKIIVDIDPLELRKPTVISDMPIRELRSE